MHKINDGNDIYSGGVGNTNIIIESFNVLKRHNNEAYNLLVEGVETGFFQVQQSNRLINIFVRDLLKTIEVQGDDYEN